MDDAFVMTHRDTGRSRGFGFVVFHTAAEAERAVGKAHSIDGRAVEVKLSVSRGSIQPPPPPHSRPAAAAAAVSTSKLFVGGLAAETTDEEFRQYFGAYGETHVRDSFLLF